MTHSTSYENRAGPIDFFDRTRLKFVERDIVRRTQLSITRYNFVQKLQTMKLFTILSHRVSRPLGRYIEIGRQKLGANIMEHLCDRVVVFVYFCLFLMYVSVFPETNLHSF